MLALRPTLMVAVPAVLDLIASTIKRRIDPAKAGLKGTLATSAIARIRGNETPGCMHMRHLCHCI